MRRLILGLLAAVAAPAAAQSDIVVRGAAREVPAGYVLGVNDELRVAVLGRPDSAVQTRILEDGTITVPLLGAVRAAGLTRQALAASIAGKLKAGGYYVNPKVGVDLVSIVSNTVTVFGQVGQPGIVPLDRPMTLAMAVASAHGALPEGADFAILRPADGGGERRVYFDDLGPAGAGLPLKPGDTVFVPEAEHVFVYGQVGQPGEFRITRGMTVRQALSRAGGVTLAGSEKRLRLYRGGKIVKKVPLETVVRDKDVLRVNERLF